MKALIVGGSGFVGPHLADYLRRKLSVDVLLTSSQVNNKKYEFLDVLNLDSIRDFLCRTSPELIFYLAAQSSVKIAWEKPLTTAEVNVFGILNFLEVYRELGLKSKILVVGSGEEYGDYNGNEKHTLEEGDVLNPGNVYAVTKACQNMISSVYAKAYSVPIVMTRTFNHFGPGQSSNFVVSDFCRQIAKIEKGLQEPVIYVGNLKAKRDFSDVRDIVDAYCRLILFGKFGETYNVGTGVGIEIKYILEELLKKSKVDIKVEVDVLKYRPIDVEEIVPNVNKLMLCTGWRPSFSLDQSLSDMLNYWRDAIK